MERSQIIQLLTRTTAEGAQKALRQCHSQPQKLTKAQAYRQYGRSDIDRWLSEKLLTLQDNKLNKADLLRIAARSNRHTYLPVAER